MAQHSVHSTYATDFTLVCTSGGTWHTFCCTICRNSRLLRAQAQARKQSETHTTLNDNGWRTENDKKYHLQIGLKHINMYILAFGRWLFHRSTFATQHNTTQHHTTHTHSPICYSHITVTGHRPPPTPTGSMFVLLYGEWENGRKSRRMCHYINAKLRITWIQNRNCHVFCNSEIRVLTCVLPCTASWSYIICRLMVEARTTID